MKRSTLVSFCAALALPAVVLTAVPSEAALAPIGGTVFRDYNHNGAQDAGEPGIAGVTATATDPGGAALTATTDSNGDYSVVGTDDETTYRVEFSWTEAWLQSAPIGDGANSSVQFIAGGATADFALSNAADYCEIADSSLAYATTCFVVGDNQAADLAGADAVVTLPGTATGAPGLTGTSPPTPTHLAVNTMIGSTYGLSWQPSTERLFTSAFLKRHVGVGTSGIGGIYTIDTTLPEADFASSTAPWYSSIDAGTIETNTARGLATTAASPSEDIAAFGQIYKVGWGDIDISADESTLYGVNLFDRSLYSIDIALADGDSTMAHTNLGSPTLACDNGEARPFAIEVHDGTVWFSLTCTAENAGGTAADLKAAVFAFDIATGSWATSPAIEFALDYTKGCLFTGEACGYQPWVDVYSDATFGTAERGVTFEIPLHPQPLVSDLEIDREGFLTIAIRDRQGDQFGHRNLTPESGSTNLVTGAGAGDILLAAPVAGGGWALESAGSAGARTSTGTGVDHNGPGGPIAPQGPGSGEFYWDDFVMDGAARIHSETGIGSLALAPGRTDVASTVTDPLTGRLNAAGVSWFSTLTGGVTNEYEIFQNGGGAAPAAGGKANALGDLEALCPGAPIQIGNRVWFDENADGIQGPSEAPIPGATVTVASGGTTQATLTTGPDGSWSFIAEPNTDYDITVDVSGAIVSELTGVTAASDLLATTQGTDPTSTLDSNMNATTRVIAVTTGAPGAHNHTLDAGFTVTPPADLELGNLVWLDSNNNGLAETGEPGIAGVTVELWSDTDANSVPDALQATTTTDANGHYNFDGLLAQNYIVVVPDQAADGEPLLGLLSSTPTTANADDDVDNDDNGVGSTAVTSGTIALGEANEPTSETARTDDATADDSPTALPDADSNLSIDFGFYPLASLGNYVWYDANKDGIQDATELPVPNVTVSICDADMNRLQNTTTDATGFYLFTGLVPGEYMVCFDLATLPENFVATVENIGDDSLDSDADVNGKTGSVTLGPGDVNLTLDLGIYDETADVAGPGLSEEPGDPDPSTEDPATGGVASPATVPVTGSNTTGYLVGLGSLSLALGLSALTLRRRIL